MLKNRSWRYDKPLQTETQQDRMGRPMAAAEGVQRSPAMSQPMTRSISQRAEELSEAGISSGSRYTKLHRDPEGELIGKINQILEVHGCRTVPARQAVPDVRPLTDSHTGIDGRLSVPGCCSG